MQRLLAQAREEILTLRRQNEILRAKVETMELFGLVFRTAPAYGSVGMSEDVAWRLQQEIDKLDAPAIPKAAE